MPSLTLPAHPVEAATSIALHMVSRGDNPSYWRLDIETQINLYPDHPFTPHAKNVKSLLDVMHLSGTRIPWRDAAGNLATSDPTVTLIPNVRVETGFTRVQYEQNLEVIYAQAGYRNPKVVLSRNGAHVIEDPISVAPHVVPHNPAAVRGASIMNALGINVNVRRPVPQQAAAPFAPIHQMLPMAPAPGAFPLGPVGPALPIAPAAPSFPVGPNMHAIGYPIPNNLSFVLAPSVTAGGPPREEIPADSESDGEYDARA